jgi:hypothetical protein
MDALPKRRPHSPANLIARTQTDRQLERELKEEGCLATSSDHGLDQQQIPFQAISPSPFALLPTLDPFLPGGYTKTQADSVFSSQKLSNNQENRSIWV